MGFYEDFIEKYDKLISWENRFKRDTKFFTVLLSKYNVSKVLDCACGTGQHVVMLDRMGLSAKGSDLSPAMIKKAKVNAQKYGVKAAFKVSDFRNLTKTFNEKFNAVICVGNSLPHLFSDKDLTKAISEMYKVLDKNGILIIQQRNYDMLIEKKKRFFPISIRKNEVFFYVLDYFRDKIIFNVVNLETKSGKFNVYSAAYNPLKKLRLEKILRKCGFKKLKFYGNFKFKKFDIRKDDNLFIVCEKYHATSVLPYS